MKKALFATSALAVAGFVAADASAVDVEMYGQVNKLFAVSDDGQNTETTVWDNDNSSTRFGMKGSQALDNGLTASVLDRFSVRVAMAEKASSNPAERYSPCEVSKS